MSRRIATRILALIALGLVSACGHDAAPAPMSPLAPLSRSGEVVTSVWQANTQGVLVYQGSWSRQIKADGSTGKVTPLTATAERAAVPENEINRVQALASQLRSRESGHHSRMLRISPQQHYRQRRRHPKMMHGTWPDGAALDVEFFASPDSTEPPIAFAAMHNGKLRLLRSNRYTHDADGWHTIATQTLLFDDDGNLRLVTTSDLSGVHVQQLGLLDKAIRQGCKAASRLGPTPLAAQGSSNCYVQQAAFLLALGADGGADWALMAAGKICALSLGTDCVAALAALGGKILSTAGLALATDALEDCVDSWLQQNGGGGIQPQETGFGFPISDDCEEFDVEASYDGGQTWTTIYSDVICTMDGGYLYTD